MNSLRILLQHRQTKGFYKNAESWTSNEADALEFSDVLSAFNFAVEHNFEEMEIIFARRLPRPDRIAMPQAAGVAHHTSRLF